MKKIIALLLALATCFFMIGCGSEEEEGEETVTISQIVKRLNELEDEYVQSGYSFEWERDDDEGRDCLDEIEEEKQTSESLKGGIESFYIIEFVTPERYYGYDCYVMEFEKESDAKIGYDVFKKWGPEFSDMKIRLYGKILIFGEKNVVDMIIE